MSFSISGGTDPWTDNDRRKLDLVDAGVLVAASAGNTGDGVPDPVGQVNHRGPWVFTVAASTKDQVLHDGLLSASGPGSPPPDTQNIGLAIGSASPDGTPLTDFPIRHFTGQDIDFEGCNSRAAVPGQLFRRRGGADPPRKLRVHRENHKRIQRRGRDGSNSKQRAWDGINGHYRAA